MTSAPLTHDAPNVKTHAGSPAGRRRTALLTAVLASATLASGCAGTARPADVRAPAGLGPTTQARVRPTQASVRLTQAPVRPTPAAVATSRTISVASLTSVLSPRPGRRAPVAPRAAQKRLVALGYLPQTAITGTWDYQTTQAVIAFQAWQGLDRDGTVGPLTMAALETAAPPRPAEPGRGRRIEVYREQGVTLLIDGSRVIRAVHSSSGKPGYATPAGNYAVFRKELDSWSRPYATWLPYASYFNGGIAFHAYDDVPAYPASHGCVRVPAPDAPLVYRFAAPGTPVSVY